ncbi:hypothetical protein V5799_018617 [Amblyomma americanum]|uniref:Lipocalin-3 1 n=1 Tax=Amblyomma americanum TaxID=6943 RepID=A0AAQ4EZW6_AMBAM
MAKLSILRGLLFTLLVATVVTAESAADNVTYDFRNFLRQGQEIWVRNTSEPGNITCRRDTISNVHNQSVSFQRHFKNNSESFNISLKGELFNWEHWDNHSATPYNSMAVSGTKGTHKILDTDEILEVLDARNECAVVKVIVVDPSKEEKPTVWRELRVVATALNKTLSQDCWNYFNGTVQNASRPSYSPSCERI